MIRRIRNVMACYPLSDPVYFTFRGICKNPHDLTHLLQRAEPPVGEAVPENQHSPIALGEQIEGEGNLVPPHLCDRDGFSLPFRGRRNKIP